MISIHIFPELAHGCIYIAFEYVSQKLLFASKIVVNRNLRYFGHLGDIGDSNSFWVRCPQHVQGCSHDLLFDQIGSFLKTVHVMFTLAS
ncbi:hypothetical protein D3C76_1580980 [compost metagenome]